jgi:hypothetical protein
MGKWALGFASVAVAVKGFKAVMESTEATSLAFHSTLNGLKTGLDYLLKSIATADFSNFTTGLKNAIRAGKDYTLELEKIGNLRREYSLKEADLNIQIEEQRRIFYEDDKTSNAEKLKAADMMLEKMKQKGDMEIEIATKSYESAAKLAKSKNKLSEDDIKYAIENYKKVEEIGVQYNRLNAFVEEYDKKRAQGYGGEKGNIYLDPFNTGAILKSSIGIEKIRKQMNSLDPEAAKLGEIAKGFSRMTEAVKVATNQFNVESKRMYRMQQNMQDSIDKENAAKQKKTYEEKLKQEEDYIKAVFVLEDKVDKSNIESLSGIARLKAVRDFGIKEIKEIRDNLAKLGPVTDEQMAMLETLAQNVWKTYKDELSKLAKNEPPQIVQIDAEIDKNKQLLKTLKTKTLPEIQAVLDAMPLGGYIVMDQKTLDHSISEVEAKIKELETKKIVIKIEFQRTVSDALLEKVPELPGLQKMSEAKQKEIARAGKQPKEQSVWSLMGVDINTDEGKQVVDAAKNTADQLKGVMDDMFQRRVDDMQRRRELLDTQIAESQRELEAEQELMRNGYANNVDLKRKELLDLKKQREKALIDEEKAIQRQRTMETISQAISLTTAVANIFKANSKSLVGVVLAVAATAAMIAAFASSKSSISSAVKLSRGATGTVTGLTHSQGGERFLDHVEVEKGEKWGVLNRVAAQKYGTPFNDLVNAFNNDDRKMIFNSFNKLSPSLLGGVTVKNDNSGQHKRLDKVNENLEKMNKQKEEVIETGTATIIIKGHTKTTIRHGF